MIDFVGVLVIDVDVNVVDEDEGFLKNIMSDVFSYMLNIVEIVQNVITNSGNNPHENHDLLPRSISILLPNRFCR